LAALFHSPVSLSRPSLIPLQLPLAPKMRFLAVGVEGPPQPDDSALSVVGPSSPDPDYHHRLQFYLSARIRPIRAVHNLQQAKISTGSF
jgi:hypothetical protein